MIMTTPVLPWARWLLTWSRQCHAPGSCDSTPCTEYLSPPGAYFHSNIVYSVVWNQYEENKYEHPTSTLVMNFYKPLGEASPYVQFGYGPQIIF